ncbi:MAG: hypothetical protein ABI881_01475 [Betaproteobacteria bacterium]
MSARGAAQSRRAVRARLSARCAWLLALAVVGNSSAADTRSVVQPEKSIRLVNADFEATPGAAGIDGWDWSVHSTPTAYTLDLDTNHPHGGKASARIRRSGNEPWGMLHQTLPRLEGGGGVLEFSAWLRTDKANGTGAILVLRTLANGSVDRYIFMDPTVTGTQDWKRYAVRLAVPAGSHVVDAGAMLQGDGTLWIDDAEIALLP